MAGGATVAKGEPVSFEDEWVQVREGAAARQDSAMRLNSAAASPGGGSGQPDLRTNDRLPERRRRHRRWCGAATRKPQAIAPLAPVVQMLSGSSVDELVDYMKKPATPSPEPPSSPTAATSPRYA